MGVREDDLNELERLATELRKALAERDTARVDAAMTFEWEGKCRALQAKVARAVAELEACEGYRPPPAVERALEVLR